MANFKCTEDMHMRCSNNALCHLCDGESLFKDPVAEKKAKEEARIARKEAEKKAPLKTHKKEKKEGMAFEKDVMNQWNQKFSKKKKKINKPRLDMILDEENEPKPSVDKPSMTIKPPTINRPSGKVIKENFQKPEAQRQFNSGAFWHSKGDIKLEHALMECKERGTTNARGEKQITIPKSWLEKQEKEAFQEQKLYWYLPFRYKNDEDIYLVKPYNHEMEMIYEMRQAREKIEQLEQELKELKGES